jgi:hypothetical protein
MWGVCHLHHPAQSAKGADPVADRRRQRLSGQQARDGIGTLTALLDLYARQQGHRLKSWSESRRRIDSVFAPFLGKPVATLAMGDLQMQADGWTAAQSAAAAVRYLGPVLKWAGQRGYASKELSQIRPPATVGRRKRVLSRNELAALLPALRASAQIGTSRSGRNRNGNSGASGTGKLPFTPPEPFGRYRPVLLGEVPAIMRYLDESTIRSRCSARRQKKGRSSRCGAPRGAGRLRRRHRGCA